MSLANLSDWFRKDILIPSGGWLADVVPIISDALAIWDIFILSTIFIVSWVVLRVSDSVTSLILGFSFDITIPLQHYLNENVKPEHQAHLDGYWPILTMTTGLELLCFFLVHPDLFTLVVCIKTTIMTGIWLGRREDGSFLTARKGSGGRPAPASGRGGDNHRETKDERWERKLKEADYDDPVARKGMIDYLKTLKDTKTQEKQLKDWTSEKDPKKKRDTMKKFARQSSASRPSGQDDKARAKEYDDRLKKADYKDPKARKSMVDSLMGMDPVVAERKLKEWEGDTAAGKNDRQKEVRGRNSKGGKDTPAKSADVTGVNPDNTDPMDFEEDLMDIRAPPGLGPPIDGTSRGRSRRGSSDSSVTGADLDFKPPTSATPITPVTPMTPASDSGSSIRSRASGGSSRTGASGTASQSGSEGYDSSRDEGAHSDAPSSTTRRSGGIRNWFRERKEKKKAKKEAARLATKNGGLPREESMRTDPPRGLFGQRTSAPERTVHYVDESDSSWNSQLQRSTSTMETGVWEQTLPQDSIELLIHYLKRGRVQPEVAGWMVMDMMTELDPGVITKKAEDWRTALNDDEWDSILEDYRTRYASKSGWRPHNSIWYAGDIDKHGRKAEGGNLDHMLWELRRNGVSTAARNAIVRDLMSTKNNESAYRAKYDRIFARATGQFHENASRATNESERKSLIREYQEKQDFDGQKTMSELEAHQVAENLKRQGYSLGAISSKLRNLRGLPTRPV